MVEPKRRGRPVGRPPALETRNRILDSAERLFAERGYPGVTVRDITALAGVDAALAHHHFGSKQALFETVVARRAEVLIADREVELARCMEDTGGRPALSDVVSAYIRPFYERSTSDDPGWKTYFKLLAKLNTSPEWAPKTFAASLDPIVLRFIDALRQAVPGVPEARYFWCYQFLAGALVITFAETGRIDRLSKGICRSGDLETALSQLIPFIVGGADAILRSAMPAIDPFRHPGDDPSRE